MKATIRVRTHGGLRYPVELTVGDAATPKHARLAPDDSSVTRDTDFTFAATPSEVVVQVTIRRPTWATSGPSVVERIHVHLRQDPSNGGGFTAAPPATLRLARLSTVDAKRLTTVELDLLFLEISAYFRQNPSRMGALDDSDTRDRTLLKPRAKSEQPPGIQNAGQRPQEMSLQFYELTTDRHPRVWSVGFSSTARTAKPTHFCVFLMPKTTAYADPPSMDTAPLARYLLSPPPNTPFFIHTPGVGPGWNVPSRFNWNHVPMCGLLEQTLRSKKNCFLVLPVPQGNTSAEPRYDILKQPEIRGASLARKAGAKFHERGIRPLLESLRRAIKRQSHRTLPPFSTARIAVAGFSSGAVDAFNVLRFNQSSVDELYWFDPRTSDIVANRQTLLGWLMNHPSSRLRLVGGNQHSPRPGYTKVTTSNSLSRLRDTLVPHVGSGRVTLIPDAAEFQSPTFVSAVAHPEHAGMRAPAPLDPSSSAATPGGLSARTGIFVHNTGSASHAIELELRPPTEAARPVEKRDIFSVSGTLAEVSGILNFVPGGQGTHSSQSAKKLIEANVESVRHQWAACGGIGDPLRNRAFLGHLDASLRLAGF